MTQPSKNRSTTFPATSIGHWILGAIAAGQRRLVGTVREIPGWSFLEQAARGIVWPVQALADRSLRQMPFLLRWEWLLEAERLRQMNPIILAIALLFVLLRGILTTEYGHIGSDPLIYPVIGAVSCFNPFLGVACGIVFGIGDLVQKVVVPDIYQGPFRSGRTVDYWSGMVGYVFAYSAVMLAGLLPGVLSRLCRLSIVHVLRYVFFRRAAAMSDGAQPLTTAISPGMTPEYPLAEFVASMVGAGLGGYAVMQAARILEFPAFYLRPHPDVSCYDREVMKYLAGRAPTVAKAIAVTGPAASTLLTLQSGDAATGGPPPPGGSTPAPPPTGGVAVTPELARRINQLSQEVTDPDLWNRLSALAAKAAASRQVVPAELAALEAAQQQLADARHAQIVNAQEEATRQWNQQRQAREAAEAVQEAQRKRTEAFVEAAQRTIAQEDDPKRQKFLQDFLDRQTRPDGNGGYGGDPDVIRRAARAINHQAEASAAQLDAQAAEAEFRTAMVEEVRDDAFRFNRMAVNFLPPGLREAGHAVINVQQSLYGTVEGYEQGGVLGALGRAGASVLDNYTLGLATPFETNAANRRSFNEFLYDATRQYNPYDYLQRLNQAAEDGNLGHVLDAALDARDAGRSMEEHRLERGSRVVHGIERNMESGSPFHSSPEGAETQGHPPIRKGEAPEPPRSAEPGSAHDSPAMPPELARALGAIAQATAPTEKGGGHAVDPLPNAIGDHVPPTGTASPEEATSPNVDPPPSSSHPGGPLAEGHEFDPRPITVGGAGYTPELTAGAAGENPRIKHLEIELQTLKSREGTAEGPLREQLAEAIRQREKELQYVRSLEGKSDPRNEIAIADIFHDEPERGSRVAAPMEGTDHSGEGGWSPEALQRMRDNRFFRITPDGKPIEIKDLTAIDAKANARELIVQVDNKTGAVTVTSTGARILPTERAGLLNRLKDNLSTADTPPTEGSNARGETSDAPVHDLGTSSDANTQRARELQDTRRRREENGRLQEELKERIKERKADDPDRAKALKQQLKAAERDGRRLESIENNLLPDVSDRFKAEDPVVTPDGKTHRVVTMSELGVPGEVKVHRDDYQQTKLSAGTGDDAGHYVANEFGAPGGRSNLGLQNWVQNEGGTWRDMERELGRCMKQDKSRIVDYKVTEVTRPGENRAYYRKVRYTEITASGEVVRHPEMHFYNSESKPRGEKADLTPPDESHNTPSVEGKGGRDQQWFRDGPDWLRGRRRLRDRRRLH
jgi:hypothetical protein